MTEGADNRAADANRQGLGLDLQTWLEDTYGPGGWAMTPLGRWEGPTFAVGPSVVSNAAEACPPYSWDPVDRWRSWIEEIKKSTTLSHHLRRMWLLNALAVLRGRLAGTEPCEVVVATAQAQLRQATQEGPSTWPSVMFIDPPAVFAPLEEWLEHMDTLRNSGCSATFEALFDEAREMILMKIAERRAAAMELQFPDLLEI